MTLSSLILSASLMTACGWPLSPLECIFLIHFRCTNWRQYITNWKSQEIPRVKHEPIDKILSKYSMFLKGIVPYVCWLKDMCVCVCYVLCHHLGLYDSHLFLIYNFSKTVKRKYCFVWGIINEYKCCVKGLSWCKYVM